MELETLTQTTFAHADDVMRTNVRATYAGYVRRKGLVVVLAGVVTVALALVSLMAGSSNLTVIDVLAALVGQGDAQTSIVVWNLRMPRILCALVGGIALASAGCVFQSVLRNPLASASTLGVAQGAAFGASVALIVLGAAGGVSATAASYEGATTFSHPYAVAICAFAGAMLSTVVMLALSRFREMTPETIVLAGVALSALLTGATALVQYFAEDSQVAAVVFWTFGDVGRVTYNELAIMVVVALASLIFFTFNRWNYNALSSGEASAHGLGVHVQRVRLLNMLVATLAASCVIAFCGTINFIGLVAPHIMRRFLGDDYRFLLPASALAGGALLMLADLLARSIVPSVVLPISAITSFIGAPLFLYLLLRGVRR